jgi:hypothetical protein
VHSRSSFAVIGFIWLGLCGFAPPPVPALDYDLPDIDAPDGPGPVDRDRAETAVPARATAPDKGSATDFYLKVEASVAADSNVTNATDDDSIELYQGDLVLPVPLDPAIRARADLALGASIAAGARIPIAEGAAIALDAEGYALELDGERNDDVSVLLAAGPELTWTESGKAYLQFTAFERWYGGLSVSEGYGLRARYAQTIAQGQRVSLTLDGRVFDSDYGADFGGTQASAYLSYDKVLDPLTTGSLGVYVRRDWLNGEAYSGTEYGLYAGLSRFLSPDLSGAVSTGVSRGTFDAPIPFLSLDPREDIRFYTTLSLTTRKPIGWSLYPSLSYSYYRTWSSVGFFDADRHRLRLALLRSF